MNDFGLFLDAHKADHSVYYSHLSLFHPKCKYLIENTDREVFWEYYCSFSHDVDLGIAEVSQTNIPVLVDADLKIECERENEDRLYSHEHVAMLVSIYQKVLREILDIRDPIHLYCFLLEKEMYFEKNKNDRLFKKNGFHLHFPYLFMTRRAQETELLPRVRMEMKKISLFPAFSEVIDKAYCRGTPWLLYGSKKSEKAESYSMSACYNDSGEKIDWIEGLLSYHLYNEKGDRIGLNEETIEYFLPRILSIHNTHRLEYTYELRDDLVLLNEIRLPRIVPQKRRSPNPPNVDSGMITKLMGMLSEERTREYHSWIEVGWILYNIYDGAEEGLDLWLDFSRRCPEKFQENSCINEWGRMVRKDMTIGSLKYIARLDDPEAYRELLRESIRKYIQNSLDIKGSHNDIAKALYEKYENEYVCASIEKKIWYHFENHVWKRDEEGVSLRKKLSNDIVQEYDLLWKDMNKRLIEEKDEDDEDDDKETRKDRRDKIKDLRNTMKKIADQICKLKSAPYKKNIMTESMEVFYDGTFMKKLDASPELVGFKNGIYDLAIHKLREGKPTDYVSMKMNIPYKTDLHEEHPKVLEVLSFFEKIFPDRSLREYFLDISSEVFYGGNMRKIVQIWTGDGDNGKSITQNFFEKMLGSYSIKLPTSLITGKRTQSSAACPELVRAGNGVRLAMLQEPDKKDMLNLGILKELSGNDTFFARGLYSQGSEITPMFKLILICNDPPKLPHDDKATWNRIRVIPFESTFCEDAPEDPEQQLLQKKFPVDRNFDQKIPDMIEALAWVLLNRYKTRPKHRTEPEKVRIATANYRKKNDLYRQFIEETLVCHKDASIDISLLYVHFRDWFRESFPHGHLPDRPALQEYIQKNWNDDLNGTVWRGYGLKEMNRSSSPLPL